MRRRDLLILAGLVAGAYGAGAWLHRPRFEFHEMTSPAGFRRLGLGAVSGLGNVFVGLDEPDPAVAARARALADPCPALFADLPGDGVPVAMFTDIQCPYCRPLERQVHGLQESGLARVTWHDPALLGPTSEAGARAILAARAQGAEDAMRRRLNAGRFVPTEGFLRAVAQEMGLEPARLVADFRAAKVADPIITARALAQVFGIPGTPALVIGRTLTIGNLSPRQLEDLVEIELREGDWPCGQKG